MFRFAKSREVLWPVTINVPVDGGGVSEAKIRVRYKLLSRTEMREAVNIARKADGNATEEQVKQDEAWLADRITGWEDVVDDATGDALAFTPDNLAALLEESYVAAAISAGLWEASRGAAAKNSSLGPNG